MSEPEVLTERDGPVLTVRLNRPERLNAVNQPLYDLLITSLEGAASDEAVRCVVLTGVGRSFCAGADLKAHAEGRPDEESRTRYVAAAQEANRFLQEIDLPVVAAVNGHAVGAGLELALSADFMVVAEDAKLRLPEVALGTFIGGGVSYTLAERVGALKAKEIVLLGDFFSGSDAAEWGLANRAVPAEEVPTVAAAWAERLAKAAPLSLAAAKRTLRAATTRERAEVLEMERAALAEIFGSADWQEGIDAFAEGREPRYRGR